MGRTPCCDKQLGLKKGPWTPEEDKILVDYIQANGHGSWRSLPNLAGLQRCGKSCRLRWTNYLRPDIKRGPFTPEEQKSIIQLHGIVGNKWSTIAAQLAGRTDNEIKNYWNTHLKKRLLRMGIDPESYAPPHASPLAPTSASATSSSSTPTSTGTSTTTSFSAARHMAQWESARLEAEARLSRDSLLIFPSLSPSSLALTASAATASSASAAMPNNPNSDIKKEPADVFLRMWTSDIGNAFRKKTDRQSTTSSDPKMIEKEDQEEEESSSCCNTKQSSALTVSEANNNADQTVEMMTEGVVMSGERREEVESNEVQQAEETSDETHRFYLELAAGDDLSLFQNPHQLGMSCYSWFGSDLNETSLDNPFK